MIFPIFVILFSVPLVFCLCEHKNYETYELIIQVLKTAVSNLKLEFQPAYWMSDYECALVKAIKSEVSILLNISTFTSFLQIFIKTHISNNSTSLNTFLSNSNVLN